MIYDEPVYQMRLSISYFSNLRWTSYQFYMPSNRKKIFVHNFYGTFEVIAGFRNQSVKPWFLALVTVLPYQGRTYWRSQYQGTLLNRSLQLTVRWLFTDSLSKFPHDTRSSILLPIHIISHTKLNNQISKSYFHFVIYRGHYDSNIIQTLYQTSMNDKKNLHEKRSD